MTLEERRTLARLAGLMLEGSEILRSADFGASDYRLLGVLDSVANELWLTAADGQRQLEERRGAVPGA